MPAQRCSNGKWKWGQRGSCVFDTEEQAERAGRAIERSTLRMQDSYKPTDGMVAEAERGLAWRREYGRGGTEVGLARARDISNRKNLPLDTVKRMKAYFDRHASNYQLDAGKSPKEDKGYVAGLLWGGDAGKSWSNKVVRQMEAADQRGK
jgi:hypothetical protein